MGKNSKSNLRYLRIYNGVVIPLSKNIPIYDNGEVICIDNRIESIGPTGHYQCSPDTIHLDLLPYFYMNICSYNNFYTVFVKVKFWNLI